MKKSITLAAILLALGTSVFATGKIVDNGAKATNKVYVKFSALPEDRGFNVKLSKELPGKSFLTIYDKDHNTVFKNLVSKDATGEKNYNITNLDYGDYTVEIRSAKQTITKQMHIYEEGSKKSYIFLQ